VLAIADVRADDGWANATQTPGTGTGATAGGAPSTVETAKGYAASAASAAQGTAAAAFQAGKEAIYGKEQ
jgi:hypothetical protein